MKVKHLSLFREDETLTSVDRKSKHKIFTDYEAFVAKFDAPKTTDDCYTPAHVYEVVKGWVNDNIMPLEGVPLVRPFYPGGDFEKAAYPEGCLVLDNPPFSILSHIRRFYHAHGIKYFLFAPGLTFASSAKELAEETVYIISGESIEYENKATVATSFITNLECGDTFVWVAGDLALAIREAQRKARAANILPSYEYPAQVTSPALLQKLAKAGDNLKFGRKSVRLINSLESQRKEGKTIFGGGFLLSEKAAAEKAAAEKARERRYWPLSDKEKAIINNLI